MSENAKEGPALSPTVLEVQGWFPDDASVQAALGRLGTAGFDRADFSLPNEVVGPGDATPEASATEANDDIEKRQMRTLVSGTAGAATAMTAAGLTLATGGAAALAAGAAAIVGLGTQALTSGAGAAADHAQVEERNRRGAAGTLVLAVHVDDQAQAARAETIMRECGATRTQAITRSDQALTAGVSAASWTG